MKIKTLLAALVIVGAPTLAAAECNWGQHETTAMSCAEGTVWDVETETCVKQVSS